MTMAPEPGDFERMHELLGGYARTAMLYAVTRFEIPDLLAEGPKACGQLATEAGVDAGNLDRILRTLALIGVIKVLPDGRFSLSQLGETLRSDIPGSLRYRALGNGVDWSYRSWGDLYYALKTGGSPFERINGTDFWAYLNANPDAERQFNGRRSMIACGQENAVIVEALDMTAVTSFVDIGAGYGALTAALLDRHPTLRGHWFDLPHAEAGARRLIAEQGVTDRCAFTAGSFLSAIPAGHDLLLLKNVVHNWKRADCLRILRNCRAAMHASSRLLVIDGLLTTESPERLRMLDLTMMVFMASRYLDAAELPDLMAAADLRVAGITPTKSTLLSIIEARPV